MFCIFIKYYIAKYTFQIYIWHKCLQSFIQKYITVQPNNVFLKARAWHSLAQQRAGLQTQKEVQSGLQRTVRGQ